MFLFLFSFHNIMSSHVINTSVTSDFVIIVTICNTCHTFQQILTRSVIPTTVYNNFLLNFVITILKFVNLSLFVTLCSSFFQKGQKRVCVVFLSHFVIKTVIAKNLDSVHIFAVFPARQKFNEEILSLLFLRYQSKEIFKHLLTSLSPSLFLFLSL